VSQACPGDPDQGATRANDHDVMKLVTSGYLERLGFDYQPASPASTFREPSKVSGAYRPPGK
jgi:phospholipase C